MSASKAKYVVEVVGDGEVILESTEFPVSSVREGGVDDSLEQKRRALDHAVVVAKKRGWHPGPRQESYGPVECNEEWLQGELALGNRVQAGVGGPMIRFAWYGLGYGSR